MGGIRFVYHPGYKAFNPAVGLTPGQQDAVTTGQAFQTDIRAQPGNAPFVAAAWMGLAQSNDITQFQFLEHAGIISSVGFH